MYSLTAEDWVRRVHHDLVKALLWPARDRDDLGGVPAAGELLPRLLDDEGRPIAPGALWLSLRAQAPADAAPAALDVFGRALAGAVAAAEAGDVAGVLALQSAFQALGAALAGDR
jgi:hypothetical protein